MCGIFGYIGKTNKIKTCIDGLKLLEYRGYDSAGIAALKNGEILSIREIGRISSLEKKININDLNIDSIIGHTRWATHGGVSVRNSHPHVDVKSSLAIVHNGIIENFDKLKKTLIKKGVKFKSDTDTEVIAQLISYHYKKNIIKALHKTIKLLKGSFAIAVIHKDFPNHIFAVARDNPIVIGFNDVKNEKLIASDANAFSGKNLNVTYLENDEIAELNYSHIKVFNNNLDEIQKPYEVFNSAGNSISKNGFEHFMLKEIFEQPFTIENSMKNRYSKELGTANFENLNISEKVLKSTKNVLIIACGTSWHAGCLGASLIEEMARIPSVSEIASEIRYKKPIISKDTLVIAISQSGETADTLAAIKEAKANGAKILGICNVNNSTLTRVADSCILLNAGPEISVCSTKAFTSQLTVLSLFSLYLARIRNKMTKEQGKTFIKHLKKIPEHIKLILSKSYAIEKIAEKYSKYNDFLFIGRRYMHHTCLEAALKLKEISYLNANAYPAGEIKHGPIALLNKKMPVIAFCANKQTYEKILNNIIESKSRQSPVLAFAPLGSERLDKIVDDVIYLPDTIDELSPFISSVAGQLFAYYIADKRGTDIDHPRNLAKSVTVE